MKVFTSANDRQPPKELVLRRVAVLAAAVAIAASSVAACRSGDITGTRNPIRIIAGANVTDTVMGRPAQALVVDVRDAAGGPVSNTIVRFEAVASTVPGRTFEPTILVAPETGLSFSTFAEVTTDDRGRAIAFVRFGTIAGTVKLVVSVPDIGARDTARYTILPGNAALLGFATRDTVVRTGATYSLGAVSADRFGNRRPSDPISFAAGPNVAAVSAAGIVTAGDPGRGYVVATTGAAKDTARVSVVPRASLVVASLRSSSPAIATIDLDGANYHVIASAVGHLFYPKWNRQGTKIIFESGLLDGIRLYVVAPGAAAQPLLGPASGIGVSVAGRFSADDNTVYFSGRSTSVSSNVVNLYRVRQGTSSPEFLGPGTPSQGFGWYPSPSPDETRLLFHDGSTLKLMDLSSRQVMNYGINGIMAHFSPDGTRIAYLAHPTGLMVMNADGSERRAVSPPERFYELGAGFDWSPDGRWLIVRGVAGLELINVESRLLITLPHSADLYQPAFHP